MESGVSLHNASSHGWSGECVDLDCHHSVSRGVMQSSLNRHSCVCWSITWDAPRTSSLLGTACKCLTFERQVCSYGKGVDIRRDKSTCGGTHRTEAA
jgi:hypothetical protein